MRGNDFSCSEIKPVQPDSDKYAVISARKWLTPGLRDRGREVKKTRRDITTASAT
jgi:hypothetical protein